LAAAPRFDMSIVASGAHLADEHGLTYAEIEQDGFAIVEKVDLELGEDTPAAIARSIGIGIPRFVEAYQRLAPDVVVLLGDRFEALAAAIAAFVMGIPIAHLHGGELTEGALDDAMRHSITKMSVLHFTAAEEYRRRVIQLGEEPDRVFCVGALGVDNVLKTALMPKAELEREVGFALGDRFVLVTFHPVTTETDGGLSQFETLLRVLDGLEEVKILFTRPNADAANRAIVERMEAFAARDPDRAKAVTSLGRVRYLSAAAAADAVVGNSSSGIIEVPSLGTPTVNIGDRQKGRLRAASVVDCSPDEASIRTALSLALSAEFATKARVVDNPYGDGHAAERIVAALDERVDGLAGVRKRFYDLKGVD
jgi:GDP/UDP-N,N'-diacetylbacillosamine 2-epimerase (hydrolysing)